MTQVVVAVGSNCNRERNIVAALDALQHQFGELLISPVYESASLNESDAPNRYYNLVVTFVSELSVINVKNRLRSIEEQQQRRRHTEQVTLDLDLLLWDDEVGDIEGIRLPHADIDHCAYVLRPLADLLPEQLHPVKQVSFKELWTDFPKQEQLIPVDFVWRQNVISVTAPLFI